MVMQPLKSLARSAMSVVLTDATVTSVEDGAVYRTISIDTRKPQRKWEPGDMIRIAVGGFDLRAYTLTAVDRASGSMTLLAFLHDSGPGSRWCATVATGDACQVFGPQRSIRLANFAAQPMVVGDETAIGLHLVQRAFRTDAPAALFEVSDVDAAHAALTRGGVSDATFVTRAPDDAHLSELEALVLERMHADPAVKLCVTGRAQTIAKVRRRLKDEGLASRTEIAKAYWDVNRTGLD